MFLLNDILDTCINSGYQFSYFEKDKLPLFIPKDKDFDKFKFYSQNKANYFDEILPVDIDLIYTLRQFNQTEYSTTKYSFFVYNYTNGIMFRHLPAVVDIRGHDLKKLFGKQELKIGFNLLVTENQLNGIISTYKFLEHIDSLKQFFNLLITKPIFSYKPFKSKLKNIYIKKNKDINLNLSFLHGLIAVAGFYDTRFYDLLRNLQNKYPIIMPITPKGLEYFLKHKYFISNIIELDEKEKLYIPNKQGKIPTKVDIQKLLTAIGRGKNASI